MKYKNGIKQKRAYRLYLYKKAQNMLKCDIKKRLCQKINNIK